VAPGDRPYPIRCKATLSGGWNGGDSPSELDEHMVGMP